MPNPEILKFSGNHRKPLFHGNSVNFHENDKIPGNSTFYASSASQVPYEKHSKTHAFWRLAGGGTAKVQKGETEFVLRVILLKCAQFNDFHHFPLKCRFRGPRSADASVATRFLFILGGSGRAIWVKNRKMPSRTNS